MLPKWLCFAMFTTVVESQFTCHRSLVLEAEAGTGGEKKHRSEASGGYAVTMFQGEVIIHDVQLEFTLCTIQLESVRYSNDGDADLIQITLDNSVLGSFTTTAQSNWGHNWNVFLTEDGFTNQVSVETSSHTITIEARSTDEYGVEIDKITLHSECTCDREEPSTDALSNDDEGSSQLSAGAIIGIVSLVLTVVIGGPSCLIAIYKFTCSDS